MTKLKKKIKDKLGEKKIAQLKKTWRVVRIIKNVVCWTLIAVLTLAIIVFTLTKINGDSPTVFGYSLHRIMSGSMEPEIVTNDVILNKDVTEASEVKLGDIVTFEGGPGFDNKNVTHRVIVEPYDNGKGRIVLVTKGDANESDDGEIDFGTVQSKYLCKINILSYIYNFFFSNWGLLVFIGLLLLIFFDEIINIIKIISAARREEEPESISDIIERMQREQREAAEKKKQERLAAAQAEITENTEKVLEKESASCTFENETINHDDTHESSEKPEQKKDYPKTKKGESLDKQSKQLKNTESNSKKTKGRSGENKPEAGRSGHSNKKRSNNKSSNKKKPNKKNSNKKKVDTKERLT